MDRFLMDIPTMLIMSSVKWKFTVRNDKKIGTLVNNVLRFFEVYKKYIDIKKLQIYLMYLSTQYTFKDMYFSFHSHFLSTVQPTNFYINCKDFFN